MDTQEPTIQGSHVDVGITPTEVAPVISTPVKEKKKFVYIPVSQLTDAQKEKRRKQQREMQRRFRARKERGIVVTPKRIRLDKLKRKRLSEPTEVLSVKYTPQKHQKAFRALLDEGKRIVLMLGGIRSGKTYAGAREALRRIYTAPCPKGIGWIISPTFPMSLVVEREFEDACRINPQSSLIIKHYKNERAYLLYPPKGHIEPYRVEIKSAEHPDRLRGASLDWIWMDEAAMMNEETWKILLGRVLDSKGTIFLTTTPKGKNWVYKEIFSRAKDDNRIGVVKATTVQNEYLDKQDVEYLRSGYSNQFAQQELAAEFVNFEGLVYHSFDWEKNTVPPILTCPDDAEVVGGMDFGLHDPTVHLWVMKFNGKFYVVDEYYCKDRTLEDHARAITANYWQRHTTRCWADPSGAQERLELDKLGIGTFEAKNDIRPGINSVQRLIEDQRLIICRNCVNTISEIGQYQYKAKEGRNSFDEPVDYANHAMDALRYAIHSEVGHSANHPFITVDERGKLRVHGDEGNALSNRLEDWISARALPLGAIGDEADMELE